MSRTPFDAFAKDLTAAALAPLGVTESDARIESDPQFADLRFVRGANKDPALAANLGLLGKMAVERALFEFAHQAPDLAEVASWQRKQLAWFQALRNEAESKQAPVPAEPPVLWGLCGGRPTSALRAYAMRSLRKPWPPGCYAGTPDRTLRVVVLAELPERPDTLLLRLFGAGLTLRRALVELAAMPTNAPERALAGRFLVRLRFELQDDISDEARDMTINYQLLADQKLQEQFEQGLQRGMEQGLERGIEQGLERGIEKGLERGIEQGLRASVALALSARGLALTDAQRAQLDAETRLDVLQRWLRNAVTCSSADDVFADTSS